MTEVVKTMINELIGVTKETTDNIYRQGVVEGVKVVKNLIESEESARDIDTLIKSLDMFIEKYEIRLEESVSPTEDVNGDVSENVEENHIDDSEVSDEVSLEKVDEEQTPILSSSNDDTSVG